ncbi:MAG: RidA family protein [Dehalococcoidia bacterium]
MRKNYSSGSPWEPRFGYSRAVRVGDLVFVAGTTGLGADRRNLGDTGAQMAEAIRIIERALQDAGATLEHVVRTRMFATPTADLNAIADAHRAAFGEVGPASTLVIVSGLADPAMLIEIEADAVIGAATTPLERFDAD